MYAIENIKMRRLVVNAESGEPDLFDTREDAQKEIDLFAELGSEAEVPHRVVDIAEYLDLQPEPLSDFEIQVAESIGRRL